MRKAALGTAVLVVAAVIAGVWTLRPILSVAVAYKAKMVCSGLYVAGLGLPQVLADLHIDDLAALRRVRVEVDTATQTVTASLFGVFARSAGNEPGQGCAVDRDPNRRSEPSTRVHGPWNITAATDIESAPSSPQLEAVLDAAFDETPAQAPRRTSAIVILHNGRIVAERYRAGINASTPLPGWSMTKSVMNALVGVLVEQKRVSLEAPLPLARWRLAGDPRSGITLGHLLRMSSGLRFDEGMSSVRSDVIQMLFGRVGAGEYAIARPLETAPGTEWQYSSVNSVVIAEVIRDVVGSDYHAFPRRALFEPLGMRSAVLETDASGTFVGSSYMYATARDWARFGQLYLENGIWNGHRILPPGWVAYTTAPALADSGRHYGAHFWLDVPEEYGGAVDHLPADAFHAVGHEGQFVSIIPSASLLIVRLGRTRRPEAWDHVQFVEQVLALLTNAERRGV